MLSLRERGREQREREREGQSKIVAFPKENNRCWDSVIGKQTPASPGESVALCLRDRVRDLPSFLFEKEGALSLPLSERALTFCLRTTERFLYQWGKRESVQFFETARELCLCMREGERDRGLPFAVSERKAFSLPFTYSFKERELSLSLLIERYDYCYFLPGKTKRSL